MLAHVVVEAAQNVFAAIDQRHLRAKAGENAGKLHRDIAAALDQDALGQLRKMKRFVGGDDVLEAGDLGAMIRLGAGRDQNRLGAHAGAVRQTHGVGILQHGAAFHQRDLEALERGGVGRFQPRDLAILVGDQRRPMKGRAADTVQP